MQLKEKIDLKKYILFICVAFFTSLFFIANLHELLALIFCFIGIISNHFFHIYGGEALINNASQKKSKQAFIFLFSKIFILAFFLIISVQMMEKKILIPVIVYLFMLGGFAFSLKKPSLNKGLEE